MKISRILAMLLLLGCASGCDEDSDPATGLPAGAPDITGIITSATASSILVEENPADDWGSAKAFLRLTDSTRVLDGAGNSVGAARLAVGQTVQAWVTGPVGESYPIQATASAIVIADLAASAP